MQWLDATERCQVTHMPLQCLYRVLPDTYEWQLWLQT